MAEDFSQHRTGCLGLPFRNDEDAPVARQHLAAVYSAVPQLSRPRLGGFSGDAADAFDADEPVKGRSEARGRSIGTYVGCESKRLYYPGSEPSPRGRQSTRKRSPIRLMEYFGVQKCLTPS